MYASRSSRRWRRVSSRPAYRQLSERLHRAHPRGQIDCAAGFRMPELWRGDQALRQYSGSELSAAARKMPRLPDENLSDVPAGGVAEWRALSDLLPRLRHDA